MNKKIFIFSLVFSILVYSLFSIEELPDGYRNIKLGMSLDETKEELLKNADFGYHGDRDVSLIPGNNRVLIETDSEYGHGSSFLKRCWFQFSEDKLYIITININRERMDYYSIFTKLSEKYGKPSKLSPETATWENDDVIMSLEKPLTLKYLDKKIFNELQNYSNIQKSGKEITQEMFLNEL